MPNYHFAWSNLRPDLLKGVVRDLQLGGGSDPAGVLSLDPQPGDP